MPASFNPIPLIETKKRGGVLSDAEIRAWIEAVTVGEIRDYQSSALLMAILIRGMSFEETLALTNAMTESGDRLSFPAYPVLLDKHSTGGIGDKVTPILAPLVAACGAPVTMLSGRGLGFSGGTIDKLESVAGVSCAHDQASMSEMLDRFGWANAEASTAIAPADRVLYRLRDVTGTVDSIPLITASILSKKMAGGASHLCMDVKCGSAAFMTRLEDATALAESLKRIGEGGGLSVSGHITRMEEPLGRAIGNYLEMMESVAYLRSLPETPLAELVLALGRKMLVRGGFADSGDAAHTRLREAVASGEALGKLEAYLSYCGASDEAIRALLDARFEEIPRRAIRAEASGFVTAISGRLIGYEVAALGAGRVRSDDAIDPLAGLLLEAHLGDRVEAEEVLAWVYGGEGGAGSPEGDARIRGAFSLSDTPPDPEGSIVLSSF